MVDDETVRAASDDGGLLGGPVGGGIFLVPESAELVPGVLVPSLVPNLAVGSEGAGKKGDEAHLLPTEPREVRFGDQSRVGDVDQRVPKLRREEGQDLVEGLEVRDLVGGVAILDGAQERETVPVHRQGEGDLLEIGTVILGVAVGGLDGTTAQRRRGQNRGRREEAVQRILFGALKTVGPVKNSGRGVEVHEGEVHRLSEPKPQSHLPENAGGPDLVESVETSSQTVVVEMV